MDNRAFKIMPFLVMLYVTIIITANILIFRMTEVDHIEFSAGAYLITPWFLLADLITEVYGYKNTKRIIWYCMYCVMIFGAICYFDNYLTVPSDWHHFSDYHYVLDKQIRVSIILFIAVILGGFINAYLISKWQIALKGRYFWLRCIGASWIGQLIMSMTTITLNFYDKLSIHQIFVYLSLAYPIKIVMTAILIVPVSILASWLKKVEGTHLDKELKFNPFAK